MATVAKFKGRNTAVVVEIHSNVLFAPNADIPNWKRRLSARAKRDIVALAPTNKRPRWTHYGKPLKTTFENHTRAWPTKGGGVAFSGVGSTAPHALYVDQGTQAHYAKILPPNAWGGGDLQETTFPPPHRNNGVWVKGIKPQYFMEKGLAAALRSMVGRSFQKPGEGVSKIAAKAEKTFVQSITPGTEVSGQFRWQLNEWRRWRTKAWGERRAFTEPARQERRKLLAEQRKLFNKIKRKDSEAKRSKRNRDKGTASKRKKKTLDQRKAHFLRLARKESLEFMVAYQKAHPNAKLGAPTPAGFTVAFPGRGTKQIFWSKVSPRLANLWEAAQTGHYTKG